MKAEAIAQVTVDSITLATPGEVNAVIDRPADIAELSDILNDARPYSGAAPADLYGVFTFSKTDSSETVLEFYGGGLFFTDKGAGKSYVLDSEKKLQLNELVDQLS